MVMEFILMGTTGLSRTVLTLEMAVATSMPSVTLPKTGCFDCPPENQSRFALFATLRKNCEDGSTAWLSTQGEFDSNA